MSRSVPFDLLSPVDLRALAQQGHVIEGEVPLSALERVSHGLPDWHDTPLVRWRAQAQWRERLAPTLAADLKGVSKPEPELWLHLWAQAQVPQTCQRCLSPFAQAVEVDRWFRFMSDESAIAQEDDDSEEDLLVFEPRFDLRALIEDELIMGLPLVPMHDSCPQPLKTSTGDFDEGAQTDERPNPFAVLAALKKKG